MGIWPLSRPAEPSRPETRARRWKRPAGHAEKTQVLPVGAFCIQTPVSKGHGHNKNIFQHVRKDAPYATVRRSLTPQRQLQRPDARTVRCGLCSTWTKSDRAERTTKKQNYRSRPPELSFRLCPQSHGALLWAPGSFCPLHLLWPKWKRKESKIQHRSLRLSSQGSRSHFWERQSHLFF